MPRGNKHLDDKWVKHCQNLHRAKLKQMRPVLATKAVKEEVEEELAGKAPREDVERTMRMSDHLQTEVQYLARCVEDIRELLDKKHAGGSGAGGGKSTLAQMMAFKQLFQAQQRERAQPSVMRSLFPQGVPFGLMGDGSNDRSLCEQEAVVLRFLGDEGKPYNTFHDLAPLHLSKSVDKHSPDADCITACYSMSLDQLPRDRKTQSGPV